MPPARSPIAGNFMITEPKLAPDGNVHVMPEKGADLIDHIESERCKCRPWPLWDDLEYEDEDVIAAQKRTRLMLLELFLIAG